MNEHISKLKNDTVYVLNFCKVYYSAWCFADGNRKNRAIVQKSLMRLLQYK